MVLKVMIDALCGWDSEPRTLSHKFGLGFRVQGLGIGDEGLGNRIEGLLADLACSYPYVAGVNNIMPFM